MSTEIQELLQVKNRILGVLLRDAREAAGRSMDDCGSLLGIPANVYESFELGVQSPSLPQLEILAYVFNLPLEHFWGTDTIAAERREDDIRDRVPELLALRQRVIGIKLKQMREKAGLSIEQVAEKAGITVQEIEALESGTMAFPINHLELITRGVQGNLKFLADGHGPVGNWLQAREEFDEFAKLPPDVRSFILKPINKSYIDLAIRLSQMEVNKLRTVAESILEITF